MNAFTKRLALGFLALAISGMIQPASAQEDGAATTKVLQSNATKATAIDIAFHNVLAQRKVENTGEQPCGISRECHVDSRVDAYIRVYINGVYRGTMAPFGDIYPLVGDDFDETTYLYAVTTDGRLYWSQTIRGGFRDYHWILRP
jgi:hypothetical protein